MPDYRVSLLEAAWIVKDVDSAIDAISKALRDVPLTLFSLEEIEPEPAV